MSNAKLVNFDPTECSNIDVLVPADDYQPNTELAIVLLASGSTHAFVRKQCGFESLRAVQLFAKDDDVRAAVKEQRGQRVQRIADVAMVSLETLLAREHTDLRAQVLAIRTALECSGELYGKHEAGRIPVKNVTDLSVSELNELIASTKRELSQRLDEYRTDRARLPADKAS